MVYEEKVKFMVWLEYWMFLGGDFYNIRLGRLFGSDGEGFIGYIKS